MMLRSFEDGEWEVVLIAVVMFILFGHRLPSVMRLLGRGVVEARQRQVQGDRQMAILLCLAVLAFLIAALIMPMVDSLATARR